MLQQFGGGLEIAKILNLHTYAHHWKEYSLRELVCYFCLLSSDFNCIKIACLSEYSDSYLGTRGNALVQAIEGHVRLLRPSLHVEVELTVMGPAAIAATSLCD